MTSATEALGLTLPGAASIPAPDSRHARMASDTGRRIVDMVWEDLKPSDIVTAASIDNAIVAVLALGGSTNAVVHLVAIARRAGLALDLDRFDALARRTPLVANVRPAGKYLMEDFTTPADCALRWPQHTVAERRPTYARRERRERGCSTPT
jgi:dihydroxy-acid dehydratase